MSQFLCLPRAEHRVRVGSLDFRLSCLADLEAASDAVLELAERSGDDSVLDKLSPYFGVVWPSAMALAQCLQHRGASRLAGARVLEVGCGLALPGIVAARLGADVVVTDRHEDVPDFLERNLDLNDIHQLAYRELDWLAPHTGLGRFEFLLGSDILYERGYARAVAVALDTHLCDGGEALVSDPGRPYLQEFVDVMDESGFTCDVDVRRIPNDLDPRDIFVLSMRRR